jgi:hypothetical protein
LQIDILDLDEGGDGSETLCSATGAINVEPMFPVTYDGNRHTGGSPSVSTPPASR